MSKPWKTKFSILCDVIFLVILQGKFEIDQLGSERVRGTPNSPLDEWSISHLGERTSILNMLLLGKKNTGTSFQITQVGPRSLGGFWQTWKFQSKWRLRGSCPEPFNADLMSSSRQKLTTLHPPPFHNRPTRPTPPPEPLFIGYPQCFVPEGQVWHVWLQETTKLAFDKILHHKAIPAK